MFTRFLRSNTPGMRAARTIVQGVLAAFIVAVPQLTSQYELPGWAVSLAVPALMSALAAGMAVMRTTQVYEAENLD